MALGSNDFDGGQIHYAGFGRDGPSKWICLHQNHYVTRHLNNRQINRYFVVVSYGSNPLYQYSVGVEASSIYTHICYAQRRKTQREIEYNRIF